MFFWMACNIKASETKTKHSEGKGSGGRGSTSRNKVRRLLRNTTCNWVCGLTNNLYTLRGDLQDWTIVATPSQLQTCKLFFFKKEINKYQIHSPLSRYISPASALLRLAFTSFSWYSSHCYRYITCCGAASASFCRFSWYSVCREEKTNVTAPDVSVIKAAVGRRFLAS